MSRYERGGGAASAARDIARTAAVLLALAGGSAGGGTRAAAATVPRPPSAASAASASTALPQTPLDGLARGRAVGRALVSFQSPDMCAIPVLVARCRSDFDTFAGGDESAFDRVPGLGPAPLARMRSYFATGDPKAFPAGFATIRTATAPDALWNAAPAVAWSMDAGIVDETVDAALHDESAIYAAPPASQMLRRAKSAAADEPLLGDDSATADGHFQAAVLDRLAAAIDARHPASPVPDLPEAYGPRGDVFLGIGFATLFQMCDAPGVAALPESQAFFTKFFAAAGRYSTVPDAARRLAADRAALRFRTGFDAAALHAAVLDLIAYQNALPGATLRRTLIGQFASQIGYNATIQRDTGFVRVVSRHVTQWNDADEAFPGLARRRVAIGLIDPSDFAAQRRASMTLVGFLLLDKNVPK